MHLGPAAPCLPSCLACPHARRCLQAERRRQAGCVHLRARLDWQAGRLRNHLAGLHCAGGFGWVATRLSSALGLVGWLPWVEQQLAGAKLQPVGGLGRRIQGLACAPPRPLHMPHQLAGAANRDALAPACLPRLPVSPPRPALPAADAFALVWESKVLLHLSSQLGRLLTMQAAGQGLQFATHSFFYAGAGGRPAAKATLEAARSAAPAACDPQPRAWTTCPAC